MNETVFQSHYRAMTDDPPRGRIHSPKREEKEVGRARKVHKAICAAISRKGVSSAISDKALFLSRREPVPESVTRALRNYQGFVEDEARMKLGFIGSILLGWILKLLLPIIIEWLIEQAMSGRMSTSDTVSGMKEWGNA